MKISETTLSILKNFNNLNPNIVIKPGNILRTIAREGSATIAMAEIEENFPTEFGIDNLSKFIGAISLFEDPDFEFFDNYVKISEGNQYVRYVYDEISLLKTAPEGKIKFPSIDVNFTLNEKDFSTVLKAASTLQSPALCVVGEDSTIYIRTTDVKNPTVSNFSMAVGVTNKEFNTIFNAANFKFIPKTYNITLCIDKLIEFNSENVTYWMAAQV